MPPTRLQADEVGRARLEPREPCDGLGKFRQVPGRSAERPLKVDGDLGLQEQVRIEVAETQAPARFENACLDEILEVFLRDSQDGARLLQLELYLLHVGSLIQSKV